MGSWKRWWPLTLLAVAACGGVASGPDDDAGWQEDAGLERDAGLDQDAGTAELDAGEIDAGGSIDGGSVDGGSVDGGSVDGGSVDGGSVDGGSVDGGSVDAGRVDGGGGGSGYACTEIHGAPQSKDTVSRQNAWFIGGVFDQAVGGPGNWQLLEGHGVNHWRYANDAVWLAVPEHPCSPPAVVDRVIQVLWADHTGDTQSDWLTKIDQIIRTARLKNPTVRTIVFQTTAGLAGCPDTSSVNRPLILQSINTFLATADAGDIRAGPVVDMAACTDLVRPFDRLTDAAAVPVAQAYGVFYAP